ncbi:MAG: flavin reductase [Lachnospiraceae bacterium]|nr:flavin reductase [Lachnospiraceae bacterium]
MDPKAMYKLSYGLFVVTSRDEEKNKDNGCITNTVMQVTSDPNRISIAVNKANYTHDLIMDCGRLNVSVISKEADFELFRRFGFQSGRDVDKFDGFADYERADNGLLYVTKGTNALIGATVEKSFDLGTHTMFIAAVNELEVLSGAGSCTYEFYQSDIKPAPAAAPAKQEGKTAWRCRICGYVYEGEELPEDFVCPICKHGAADFERITV